MNRGRARPAIAPADSTIAPAGSKKSSKARASRFWRVCAVKRDGIARRFLPDADRFTSCRYGAASTNRSKLQSGDE
jgi:hypothetical protein